MTFSRYSKIHSINLLDELRTQNSDTDTDHSLIDSKSRCLGDFFNLKPKTMLVKTFGSALNGIEAITVTIEVNIDRGVQFFLVGLPDSAVKESQQRIEAALNNNNLKYPKKKITINMAPADIRKEGSSYDL